MKYLPHDGEQLLLFSTKEMGELPWRGRSPRGLTRARKIFSLGAGPAGGLRADAWKPARGEEGSSCNQQLDLLLYLEGEGE